MSKSFIPCVKCDETGKRFRFFKCRRCCGKGKIDVTEKVKKDRKMFEDLMIELPTPTDPIELIKDILKESR